MRQSRRSFFAKSVKSTLGFTLTYLPKELVLMGQCLNRRIGKIEEMKKEVKAWQQERNNKKAAIICQFTNDKARVN